MLSTMESGGATAASAAAVIRAGLVGKSQESDSAQAEFPPRKRSIPYGFDFDLDEVWAPHMQSTSKNHPPPLRTSSLSMSRYHSKTAMPFARKLDSSGSTSSENSLVGLGQESANKSRANGAKHRDREALRREAGAARRQQSDDSMDEFAVENEDIFQKISGLNIDNSRERNSSSSNSDNGGGGSSNSSSGLPSARALRGGRSLVARGRHGTTNPSSPSPTRSTASSTWSSSVKEGRESVSPLMSTQSSFSSFGGSGSGRYSSVSPSSSPRKVNGNKLMNPGLRGEGGGGGGGRGGRQNVNGGGQQHPNARRSNSVNGRF